MKINSLFRKRIGISEEEEITFDKLGDVLEKTAQSLPFENLSIMEDRTRDITEENLIEKVLVAKEGGLCYELNPIFYLFLIENGWDATLVRGRVYNIEKREYHPIGKTHVAITVVHQEKTYLVDTGFGANLPLKPVPLSGGTITSRNGEFRIKTLNSENGDYILEMKLKDKHTEWQKGYAFFTDPVKNVLELNEIQTAIRDRKESPFNKSPLVSVFTANGRMNLTNTHFTQWSDGVMKKEQINEETFKEHVKKLLG